LIDQEARLERHRLLEDIARKEQDLLRQRVCILKPLFASCSLDSSLAGITVKLKCRSKVSTLLKTDKYRVPPDGNITFCELAGRIPYEGDDALNFQVCRVRRFRPSIVIATGRVLLAAVFSRVGLKEDADCLSVSLISVQRGHEVGTLKLNLRCGIGSLGAKGGGIEALKINTLPPRPDPYLIFERSKSGSHETQVAKSYADSCAKVCAGLQAAMMIACSAADTVENYALGEGWFSFDWTPPDEDPLIVEARSWRTDAEA